jgi:hypothetical protein
LGRAVHRSGRGARFVQEVKPGHGGRQRRSPGLVSGKARPK